MVIKWSSSTWDASSSTNYYLDFCQIAILIKNKEHLTKKGLNTIEKIKDGMNTKRG